MTRFTRGRKQWKGENKFDASLKCLSRTWWRSKLDEYEGDVEEIILGHMKNIESENFGCKNEREKKYYEWLLGFWIGGTAVSQERETRL